MVLLVKAVSLSSASARPERGPLVVPRHQRRGRRWLSVLCSSALRDGPHILAIVSFAILSRSARRGRGASRRSAWPAHVSAPHLPWR